MAKKSVTFSFDDGVKQDVWLVELFNKYGVKCTFNLNTGLADEKYRWRYNDVDVIHMNKADMLGLYKGHEVAIHTLLHPHLKKLDELDKTKKIYVMCQSGLRSCLATRILMQNGFDAYNFAGGFRLYSSIKNEELLSKQCYTCGMEK